MSLERDNYHIIEDATRELEKALIGALSTGDADPADVLRIGEIWFEDRAREVSNLRDALALED